MLTFTLLKIWNTSFVHNTFLILNKYKVILTLAIHLSCGRTLDGQKITAGMLQNPTALQHLVQTEQAYKFLKNIRGSPAYWQHELYDVLAMLCSLGIPTWFLTLSAADLHWPEMIQAVALQLGRRLSRDDVMKMSIAQRSTYLQQNPITGVLYVST